MSVKVSELMSENVVTVQPHHTVGHVKTIFSNNSFNTLPVVDTDGEPVGIISTSDLIGDIPDGSPVNKVMTEKVYSVALYSDVELAARMMRKHKIHHLVVTHEQQVSGIISSFDLLALVEGRRFTMKNPPTPKKNRGKRSSSVD